VSERIQLDYEQVRNLAAIQCTDLEMASVLGCSRDTLKRRKKDDPLFLAAYDAGKAEGRASLRRLQWRNAEQGNVTMQIWLGKQYLGQSDKTDVLSAGEKLSFKININGNGNGQPSD
jgi:hypothetical protein